ncbi:hypothetical protein GQ43DRAFT_467234 [Delitschia confertaspora ATCC 74209]|uniref:Uncharacterized protein n=1 Tax=Delitschia confertaspora ATCC 74209 TaxID=1513339 RepID=A0A9P4JFM8_9PLEO|nr:hypothetical protein GQ43DRAFT_467234 [Delitschia confertaspora ATCC 74209]
MPLVPALAGTDNVPCGARAAGTTCRRTFFVRAAARFGLALAGQSQCVDALFIGLKLVNRASRLYGPRGSTGSISAAVWRSSRRRRRHRPHRGEVHMFGSLGAIFELDGIIDRARHDGRRQNGTRLERHDNGLTAGVEVVGGGGLKEKKIRRRIPTRNRLASGS